MDEQKVADLRVAHRTLGEDAAFSECQLFIRAMPAVNHLIHARTDASVTGYEHHFVSCRIGRHKQGSYKNLIRAGTGKASSRRRFVRMRKFTGWKRSRLNLESFQFRMASH